MKMNWILLNIPLGALMVAFTVGLPLWVMLKHPDGDDGARARTATPMTREHPRLYVAGTLATTGSVATAVVDRRAV